MAVSIKHLDFLKQACLNIAHIPHEELAKLQPIFYPYNLKKNEFFLKEGEHAHQIALIVTGIVRFYYITENGEEFIKSFAAENTLITSYSAILQKKTSTFSIQALEDSLLLVVNYKDFAPIIEKHPSWKEMTSNIVTSLYLKKERRENQLLIDDAKTRYKKFKTEFPNLENRIPQYHIASYLGITNVSLSRLRKK